MTNNFYPPITPTPELVKQWCYEDGDEVAASPRWFHIVCTKAARWGADQQLDLDAEQINKAWQAGADQELDACRLWVSENCDIYSAVELIRFRRPKPPSLKDRALHTLRTHGDLSCAEHDTIRRALEQLND